MDGKSEQCVQEVSGFTIDRVLNDPEVFLSDFKCGGRHTTQRVIFPGQKSAFLKQVSLWEDPIFLTNERDILSKLNHPQIPKLYDSRDDGRMILMEDKGEKNLGDIIHYTNKPSERLIFDFANMLLNVLVYLQSPEQTGLERGIVHTDIKPANIVIGEEGLLSLIDFEFARYDQGPLEDDILYGTADFVDIFANNEKKYTFKNDLFGLGLTLYRLYHGRRISPNMLRLEVNCHDRFYIRNSVEGVPEISEEVKSQELREFFLRMMSPETDVRFSSAREAIDYVSGCYRK